MILKEFITHRTVVEKYDVARRTAQVNLQFGYPENVPDFGWTAAVFTELYAQLPEGKRWEVLRLDGVSRMPQAEQLPADQKALAR
jgi:hypothetical protein